MPSKYEQLVNDAARKYNLPPDYLHKLIQYESRGNPRAVSSTGATGLAQFTRGTAKQYGLKDRTDPVASIDAAARLAADNRNVIRKSLGREPTSSELYLGHLQGAGTAGKGFRSPDARAVDVFGRQAVAVNLPKSQRGNLENITAKQFQDLHQGNFNRTKGGTIDIGATPQLAQLQPQRQQTKQRDPNAVATSILTQSSPMTEGNNMARYPGFNEAIRQSMTGNTENVEAVPSSFIPPDTDLKGRTKLAGAIPSGSLRAPKTKATPKGQKAGAHKDVPDAPEQMGGSYADYVKKEKAKMAEEKKKLSDSEIPPSGTIKTDPDVAGAPGAGGKKVKTDITGPLAAVGAGGAYTAFSDPALQSVIDTINGAGNPPPAVTDAPLPPNVPQPRGGTTDPALQRVMEVLSVGPSGGRGDRGDPTGGQLNQPSPAPGRGGYNVDPQVAIVEKALGMKPGTMGDPNSGPGQILAQAMPAFQQAMSNPRTRQAAMETAKGIVSSKAQIDSQAAARGGGGRDPTFYQRQAAGIDPSDPQYERMMQIAVARDAQSRGSSPRGVVPGQQQQRPPMQSAPAVLPQEQIPMPRPRPMDAPQMQQPQQPGVPMPRPRPPEAPLIPNNHSFVQNPTDQILQEFYNGQSTGGGIMP